MGSFSSLFRRTRAPRLALLASSLLLLRVGVARGAEPGPGVAGVPAPAIAVVLDLPPGSPLDAARLEAAIARELGAPITRQRNDLGGGVLLVRQEGHVVTVSFTAPGRGDIRTFTLEDGAPHPEDDVALIAENVARDQTSAFLPTAAAVPTPPAPPPSLPPRETAPPARPAMSGLACAPLTIFPVGIDFVPFAGTSSFSWGRSPRAFSLGMLGALSGGIDGVAVSGLANIDTGPVCGVEVAGLVNVAPSVRGVAASGLVNVATKVEGVQIGGLVDVAAQLEGVQVGGLANVASEDSIGLQAGPINVAAGRFRGVQIGVINVANDADAQIGLLNVDLHGRFLIDAWSKPEEGMLLAGIKHGTPHVHSIYAFEIRIDTGRPWAVLGLGAHATPSARVYVDIDLLQHTQILSWSSRPNTLSEVRAVVGYRIFPRLSIFAGPTFNVLFASDPSRADAPAYGSTFTDGATQVRLWPGAALGLEAL